MRINFISASPFNYQPSRNIAFKAAPKEQIIDDLRKIEYAIYQIEKDPDSEADLVNLAKKSGLSRQAIVSRFNTPEGKNLSLYWADMVEISKEKKLNAPKTSSQPSNCNYNQTEKSQIIQYDIEKIDKAIQQIEEDDSLEKSVRQISDLTGLEVKTVYNRLNHPLAKKTKHHWNQLMEANGCAKLNTGKRVDEFLLRSPLANKINKMSQYKKAIEMINTALSDQGRLSYRVLQERTGLSRDEIDKLIEDYANYRNSYSKRVQERKEEQARWYREYQKSLELMCGQQGIYPDTFQKQTNTIEE